MGAAAGHIHLLGTPSNKQKINLLCGWQT